MDALARRAGQAGATNQNMHIFLASRKTVHRPRSYQPRAFHPPFSQVTQVCQTGF